MLYQAVAWNLETFLSEERRRGIPSFVERELRSFLDCGIPAHGFLRLHCESCGKDKILPFSCKTRGFCPACCGRRMSDTASHLVDHVFPRVPVRQWVLSVPHRVRYLLAYDPALVTAVYQVFARAVFGFQKRRARQCGVRHSQGGAVTFVQRFGNSLNLHLHYHMLALDGVYWQRNAAEVPEFLPLPAPSDLDIEELAATLARRISALLKRRQAGPEDGERSDSLRQEEPWLSDVYTASILGRVATGPRAGQRVRKDQVDADRMEETPASRCASVEGFSLHADVAVPAPDRQRLERLARYVARPPLCEDRLDGMPDGRLVYIFKRPWRDGTDRVVLDPEDFLARLAALVPRPRAHLVRFSGILAPAAKWRASVVPHPEAAGAVEGVAEDAEPPAAAERPPERGKRPRNYPWSELMKRVFSFDVMSCSDCGGKLKLLAAIHPPDTTSKILQSLGLPSRPPPIAPARRSTLLDS